MLFQLILIEIGNYLVSYNAMAKKDGFLQLNDCNLQEILQLVWQCKWKLDVFPVPGSIGSP